MMITGWTVLIDGDNGLFPIYPTRAKAREAAAAYREHWKKHRYTVARVYGSEGLTERELYPMWRRQHPIPPRT